MCKPSTYLFIYFLPTYLPMFRTHFLQNGLLKVKTWILTQLKFIHNGVISGIQWMILVGAGSLWATSTSTSSSSFHYSSSLTETASKNQQQQQQSSCAHPSSFSRDDDAAAVIVLLSQKGQKRKKTEKKKRKSSKQLSHNFLKEN